MLAFDSFSRARRMVPALAACAALVGLAVALATGVGAQEPEEAPGGGEETTAKSGDSSGGIYHVRVDSIIHPVVAQFLVDVIDEAEDAGAAALIIELSTPGGLVTSTREIFTAMLGADFPVVVYVSPSGAQAASAGFFLLMAADVAAMAPGTNAGAAAVVGGQGEEIEGKMGEKVQQDAAATVRSLAARHGRNAELAEAAVLEARSFTAEEALEATLIELIVPSLPRLLSELDGRTIEKHDRQLTLATAEAAVEEREMSPFQRFLAAIAHPNIAYLLLTLGGLGIYFELANPGSILPGVVGAICLILAFFALSVLPVNYAGVALIILASVLFLAEVKVQSFGLLTVAGVISLVLGSLMLFKTPEPALRVSLELIATLAAVAVLLVVFLSFTVLRTFRSQVKTGVEGMVSELGVARSVLDPRGKVAVHGEIWDALADEPVSPGEAVEVTAVQGMLLRVRRVGGTGRAPGAA